MPGPNRINPEGICAVCKKRQAPAWSFYCLPCVRMEAPESLEELETAAEILDALCKPAEPKA